MREQHKRDLGDIKYLMRNITKDTESINIRARDR